MGKIEFSNGVMQFISCSIPFPTNNGLHIVSSGCGSGKSTMIQEIIKEKWSEGILVVVATIEAGRNLGEKQKNGLAVYLLFIVLSSWCCIQIQTE